MECYNNRMSTPRIDAKKSIGHKNLSFWFEEDHQDGMLGLRSRRVRSKIQEVDLIPGVRYETECENMKSMNMALVCLDGEILEVEISFF
ncbi:hypothetical protein CDAR_600491 [Caerostris darwini]|uniref:Uncharacterized protein n=1 Tax=Caerostris darwini TaxID=1538125 RepID=A0AAV4TY88_9ARAC|nr:hypothetical protein CDAR_600491 [Caerostris darwini]